MEVSWFQIHEGIDMKIKIIKESRSSIQQSQVHKNLMNWWYEWRKEEIRIISVHGREAGSKTQRSRISNYKQIDFEFLQELPIDINIRKLEIELDNYYTSLGSDFNTSGKRHLLKRIACILGLKSKVGNWVCRSQFYRVQL